MKPFASFFLATVAVLFLSVASFSQEMKPLLAMDASLNQVQAWLSKTIDKNSTYKSNSDTTDSISKVAFDGCRVSYKISSEHGTEQVWSNPTGPLQYNSTVTTLAFDLKEMNLNGITLTPLVSNSNMLLLTLPSLQGKSVSFDRDTGNFKFNGRGFQSAATMAIKASVAEQVKNELLKAAVLCR